MQTVGTLTLNANPTNYFAETEQVAFVLGNLVPGIDVTDDPLLQARLFSYLDTQITGCGPSPGNLTAARGSRRGARAAGGPVPTGPLLRSPATAGGARCSPR